MSKYYQAPKTYGLYKKGSKSAFKLSRSKIDLFKDCPRCFYYDRKLGVGRPPGFPFNLNSAVDHLLKKEFDAHRAIGEQHPLLAKYGVDAKPAAHDDLDQWRENFVGIRHTHKATNFLIFGAIDDLWINDDGEYIVVDYKATSKEGKIERLDADWHITYKRQLEVYQWLLRQNGHKVSSTGYWVYCNGKKDEMAFDGKLEFEVTLIPYDGDDSWIEPTLLDMKALLDGNTIPPLNPECDYCTYVRALVQVSKKK